jgi:hypothetical protein
VIPKPRLALVLGDLPRSDEAPARNDEDGELVRVAEVVALDTPRVVLDRDGGDVPAREELLEEHDEVGVLVLVDGDDHDAARLEHLPCDPQPTLHERQPLRGAPSVVGIHVVVVVGPVPVPGVVWRIQVDDIEGVRVCRCERLDRVVVLALDDDVMRLAFRSASNRVERGENRVELFREVRLEDHLGPRPPDDLRARWRGPLLSLLEERERVGLDGANAEASRRPRPPLPDDGSRLDRPR